MLPTDQTVYTALHSQKKSSQLTMDMMMEHASLADHSPLHLQVLYHYLQFCSQLCHCGAITSLLVKNYNWDRMPPWLNELCQVIDMVRPINFSIFMQSFLTRTSIKTLKIPHLCTQVFMFIDMLYKSHNTRCMWLCKNKGTPFVSYESVMFLLTNVTFVQVSRF